MFHFKALIGLVVFLGGVQAQGAGPSSSSSSSGSATKDFLQRADRREAKRWTLQEWMLQKDRNRMMDMWLSMNSPSPYELMLGGSYNSFQTETGGNATVNKHTSYQGTFSAYAQLVGLTAEYENNTEEGFNDLAGMFNLRLIGDTIQGTYLALHYGQRTRNVDTNQLRLNQQFGQVSLQIYATKFFGFDGLYRQYLPMTDATVGDVTGNLTEGGAFIDFKNFRIYGTWYKEQTLYNQAGTETNTTRSGIKSGLKIFF